MKPRSIISGILAIVAFFYFTSPYRGGISRFEEFFGVKLPQTVEQIPLYIFTGSYWDDPRFRFQMTATEFAEFKETLKSENFSDWKELSCNYGSFNEESETESPQYFSSKINGRWKLMLFYRSAEETLDAVTFFN